MEASGRAERRGGVEGDRNRRPAAFHDAGEMEDSRA